MLNQVDQMMSDLQSQKLQITVSCRNLADQDFLTVTDSFLIVHLKQFGQPEKQILRTKVYWNDPNPDYVESVIIDYFFQIRQILTFQIYHQDSPPKLLGSTKASVGEIFGSLQNSIIRPLQNSKQKKQMRNINIRCHKIEKFNNQQVQFTFRAHNLSDNRISFFKNINPFFRVYRKRQKDDLILYQSQHKQNETNPHFKQFKISEQILCKNDESHPFEIRILDYSNNDAHKQIGSCYLKMTQVETGKSFPIRSNKNGKIYGMLQIQLVNRFTKYQFGDYIQHGLQLSLIQCIDFTASNGIAKMVGSHHYMAHGKPSQYAQALGQVTKIVLDYDQDKLVPVFGFGAKVNMPNLNSGGKVDHCFPINGNPQNPKLDQVRGIIEEYSKCIQYIQFGGPTMFSSLLKEAVKECQKYQRDHNKYTILFILTDGQIHDKKEVIDQIIACGRLPISIIIVGIGNGDFGVMNELEDKDCQLRDSKDNKNERPLVQFVEFNQFKNNGIVLAKKILKELPRQIAQYYQIMGLTPNDVKNVKTDIQYQKLVRTNYGNSGKFNSNKQPVKGTLMQQ